MSIDIHHMRWMLNGQFTINGQDYWRIEDTDNLFVGLSAIQKFHIAVNTDTVPAERIGAFIEHLNTQR